ncbi:MAG: putative glycolipid-binding domain-containing protein [Actinomycetota bacterium]|nr:putative glycolipid-binding domain-containing protein [Actinomycetota bacterium]
MTGRLVLWRGIDAWRAEAAEIEFEHDGLRARGVQLGSLPHAYRLEYQLDATAPGFVTRTLDVQARGEGWARSLRLSHEEGGQWRMDGDGAGDPHNFAEALDCDLAFSPLTNTMPIRRHHLNEREGRETLLIAWVSVPDLVVTPSRQHYTHIGRATVRYESESRDFVADLELDRDGVVIRYPGLAERMS